MIETERKFLVLNNAYKTKAFSKHQIKQGYLNSNPERAVRVRIKDNTGFLTIKGKSNESGTTRFEWETEITLIEAEQLLLLCEKGIIDKIRYNIKAGKHIFEVDEFFGDNRGLIIAEIELNDEKEYFEKPEWLGKEVTGNKQYYNAYISLNPFCDWK